MATKTISVDLAAYDRLVKARKEPTESFSCVIHRAIWPPMKGTAGMLLEALSELPPVGQETIDALVASHEADQLPEDPWEEYL